MPDIQPASAEREAARHALVAALLTLRARPAEAAFESLLAATLERGALDPLLLRELRWWHRASQDEFSRQIEDLLPKIWGLLAESDEARLADFERDKASWAMAAGLARPDASVRARDTDTRSGEIEPDPTPPTLDLDQSHSDLSPDSEALPAESQAPVAWPDGSSAPAKIGPDKPESAATTDESAGSQRLEARPLPGANRQRALYELRRTDPRPYDAPVAESIAPNGAPTPRRLVVGLTVLPGD